MARVPKAPTAHFCRGRATGHQRLAEGPPRDYRDVGSLLRLACRAARWGPAGAASRAQLPGRRELLRPRDRRQVRSAPEQPHAPRDGPAARRKTNAQVGGLPRPHAPGHGPQRAEPSVNRSGRHAAPVPDPRRGQRRRPAGRPGCRGERTPALAAEAARHASGSDRGTCVPRRPSGVVLPAGEGAGALRHPCRPDFPAHLEQDYLPGAHDPRGAGNTVSTLTASRRLNRKLRVPG
jgi:hypothetical protein